MVLEIGEAARTDSPSGGYEAEIRRTSYGIPHIKARDSGSLAFGVAYAYAEDNLELLVDTLLTVRGRRSRYLGAAGVTTVGGADMSNVESDFFFRFYLGGGALAQAYAEYRERTFKMAQGYAAGFNAYLRDGGLDRLSGGYREAMAAEPMTAADFCILVTQKAAQSSGEGFARAMLAASPPSPGAAESGAAKAQLKDGSADEAARAQLGSNAFLFGREVTKSGHAILAGNPHFPWQGHKRFYQMHLTIPGELDVMGAALPPFPVINIGFNKSLAWTHTVAPSCQFVIYELKLKKGEPLQYVVDGRPVDLDRVEIKIDVRGDDGVLSQVSRVFYRSIFGTLLSKPELGVKWSAERAYAFHDIALPKLSVVDQWWEINRSEDVRELKSTLAKERGTLWLNTLAADKAGDVFYANASAVPDVSFKRHWRFAPSPRAVVASRLLNIPVLAGVRSAALLATDHDATTGMLPESKMPSVLRSDYVLNCNDSHWLTNVHAPLTGYSRLVGKERVAQGMRTRMGHRYIAELLANTSRSVSFDDVKAMTFSTRNMAAEMVLDAICPVLRAQPLVRMGDGEMVDLEGACIVLERWDRCDDLESPGAVLFREFWKRAMLIKRVWARRFDPRDPVETPGQVNVGNKKIVGKLRLALAETVRQFSDWSFPLDVTLSKVQRYPTVGGGLGVPGGRGDVGVLNQVLFGDLKPDGYDAEKIYGSSYTQVVTWGAEGPVVDAILPFSQSSDLNSPHYSDQMELFSQKMWVRLPFSEAEIQADPNLSIKRVSI